MLPRPADETADEEKVDGRDESENEELEFDRKLDGAGRHNCISIRVNEA